ncbi:hypothetical protein KSP39_PZI022625 [Platanthera zijinensis]|uniref:Uncharacterized protein n=1 Tax=Platanthera zijinensis TaxID=2320716 RepID=A0AAP0FUC5_9ASPA
MCTLNFQDATQRPQNLEVAIPTSISTSHGYEVAVEFKTVERPIEPHNYDQPVRCPMPEQSILNDGTIWKERMTSVSTRMRAELPVVKEGSQLSSEAAAAPKPPRPRPRRAILPSVSAPEGNLIALLDEYNATKDHYNAGSST